MSKPTLSGEILRKLFPEPSPHLADPGGWVRERLGEELWSKQREIAASVAAHRYTAVHSAFATGKSFVASRLMGWWIDSHDVGSAFVVSTAPTTSQVTGILWRELSRMHAAAGLAGRLTLDARWYVRTAGGREELVALGRKPGDADEAAFQGLHAAHILVVIDEAAGLGERLWDAVDGLAANESARVLAIGNPDVPDSRFAKVCAPGSGWHVIHVDGLQTPNFTGEVVSERLRHSLISQTWVQERRARWGESSPIFQSKVRGLFPRVGADALIAPAWLRAAHERELPVDVLPPARLGVDVARSGSDRTVVAAVWPSGRIRVVHDAAGADTMQTAGHVLRLLRDEPFGPPERIPTTAAVDVIGLGAGVFDRLREQGANVVPFNSASRPHDPALFANRRAEAFWSLREALERGEVDLDPDDDALAAQLGSLRWKVNSRGRILIESKDEMRARGLPSPDRADGVSMAFARRSGTAGFVAAESYAPHPLLAGAEGTGPVSAGLTDDLLDARW
ncbi:MAG: hypothetical protein QOH72_5518 [Solirubrobacteraceae bacterium]|jgi:hypothetical protein|nr:hypothetical protein [Solirubrobacteraceae bacterium]